MLKIKLYRSTFALCVATTLAACSDSTDVIDLLQQDSAVTPPPTTCDSLTPSYCGFPYPNDYWSVKDPDTSSGRRLALPADIFPVTVTGQVSETDAVNEMDGFSPGIAAMVHLPGATVTGLATPDSIEASLAANSATIILNADTGERIPHWVDRDEYVVQAKLRVDAGESDPSFNIDRGIDELREEQAFMLRPAIRLDDATHYIIAIRNVVDENGTTLPASQGFAELRDQKASTDDVIRSRRAHFENLFDTLAAAGIPRNDLQIAWDFTTSSRENNTAAMLHIRDDALARYPNGVSYTIEDRSGDLISGMACRLEVTFDVPLYMTGGETGSGFNLGDNGLPEQNGFHPYSAALIVPISAQTEAAPLVAFGHGQLGAKEQVLGTQPLAVAENFAFFGLDWKGFSGDDTATVVNALTGGNISDFRVVPERMHQGFLNFLIAMRTLSVEADGGPSTPLNEALNTYCGGAVLDGSKRYFFGGSQGGILGASLMAINTDIERGLLAVPGQSYNLLLNRSVNFDPFAAPLYSQYNWNALDMQMVLALVQGLWDRAEPTGYSKYIRENLLPNTPAHEVVVQVSKADHQVTNLGAHIMARTIGGVVNLAPLIRDVWGFEVVEGEHTGSGMIEIDFGNPLPPITNIPHWADTDPDPHGRATELEGLGSVLRRFYDEGVVSNPCDGPCSQDDLL